ncbi:hypothetical protein NQ314_019000 [Rhamnusium bicolor]|uniref:Peptidase S1 domain-containing protein n=1 Tax=Rhamnusium bicolor TaxID=1586634 RepID=A0AAV8WPN7_9CUCU|nr:hypothetical protein NQ314_019000 [Rhamnusium bicolor]
MTNIDGHYARVSGWGLDSDNATTISPVLRQVTIPIISNERCNVAYVGVIQDTHICASGLGGRSTCSGDSGGPLTVAGVQVNIYLITIIVELLRASRGEPSFKYKVRIKIVAKDCELSLELNFVRPKGTCTNKLKVKLCFKL